MEQIQQIPVERKILRDFSPPSKRDKGKYLLVVAVLLVVSAGVVTGKLLAGREPAAKNTSSEVVVKGGEVQSEEGVDVDVDRDADAAGILKEGGIDGEGTHYLDREEELGPGKNVYLFSTSINLQNFVNKKVEVWGLTVSGKRSGWLMDVVKVRVAK